MIRIDLGCSLTILAAVAVALVFHARQARASYARVERDGGSPLLNRDAMNAGYRALQPIAAILVRSGVSANAVTLGSLALSTLSAGFVLAGHFGVAALLGVVSACGDALDGLVARATGTASEAGQLLDATVDRYEEFLLIGALAIHFRADVAPLSFALLALLGSFATSYVSARSEAHRIDAPRGLMRRAERATYILGGLALAPMASAQWGSRIGNTPVFLSLALVGVLANASAVHRLVVLMQRLQIRAGAHTPSTNTWGLLGRHQIAALLATVVDFAVMIAAVEFAHVGPAAGTALGALVGAAANFSLGRRWIFDSTAERMFPQAVRYAVVSGTSLALNSIGEYAAAERIGVPYIAARLCVSLVVSLLWNFPMQRHVVFAAQPHSDAITPASTEELH